MPRPRSNITAEQRKERARFASQRLRARRKGAHHQMATQMKEIERYITHNRMSQHPDPRVVQLTTMVNKLGKLVKKCCGGRGTEECDDLESEDETDVGGSLEARDDGVQSFTSLPPAVMQPVFWSFSPLKTSPLKLSPPRLPPPESERPRWVVNGEVRSFDTMAEAAAAMDRHALARHAAAEQYDGSERPIPRTPSPSKSLWPQGSSSPWSLPTEDIAL